VRCARVRLGTDGATGEAETGGILGGDAALGECPADSVWLNTLGALDASSSAWAWVATGLIGDGRAWEPAMGDGAIDCRGLRCPT
jgi:hypothetical protein